MHENSEMTIVGYVMAAVLVIVLLPLAPFFLVYLLIDVFTADATDAEEEEQWGADRSRARH